METLLWLGAFAAVLPFSLGLIARFGEFLEKRVEHSARFKETFRRLG